MEHFKERMWKLCSIPQTVAVADSWLTVLQTLRGPVIAQSTRTIHENANITSLGASSTYNHPDGMVCMVGLALMFVGVVALTIKLATKAMVVVIEADSYRDTHATQATCTNQEDRLVC